MAPITKTYTVTFYESEDEENPVVYENVSDIDIYGSEIRCIRPDGTSESFIMSENHTMEVEK